MPDKKIMAGGAVLFGAAFWFYIKPNYLDSAPPVVYTEEQIAEAPRPTIYLGKAAGEKGGEDPGIVFNLKAPPNTPNYVKVVMALEFEDPLHKYIGAVGAGVEAKNVVFAEELKPEMHKILDAITSTFGAKSVDEVSTTAGREKLKAEIVKAVNAQLHHEQVTTVYFSTFITQ
jgi:flagellar basal body-associated protein FliL